MRSVVEIKCSIFVIDDIDIEVITNSWTNTTGNSARARFVSIDGDATFFADMNIRFDAIA